MIIDKQFQVDKQNVYQALRKNLNKSAFKGQKTVFTLERL